MPTILNGLANGLNYQSCVARDPSASQYYYKERVVYSGAACIQRGLS